MVYGVTEQCVLNDMKTNVLRKKHIHYLNIWIRFSSICCINMYIIV